jgi:hypothetical protein
MLQFGYAVIPYLLRRTVSPGQEAGLGWSWLSLPAVVPIIASGRPPVLADLELKLFMYDPECCRIALSQTVLLKVDIMGWIVIRDIGYYLFPHFSV